MNTAIKKTIVEEVIILLASIFVSILCMSITVLYSKSMPESVVIYPKFVVTKFGYFGTFLLFFSFYLFYLFIRLAIWVIKMIRKS